MKMKFKIAVGLLAIVACTLTASAQLGGYLETLYSAVFHSPGGATNITTGYTNPVSYVDVSRSSIASFQVAMNGNTVNCSNAVLLRVWPAFSGSTKATTHGYYITMTPAVTDVITITNLVNVGSPFLAWQLESQSGNLVTMTNVTVKVMRKNQ